MYVGLSVQIHGLETGSDPLQVARKVKQILLEGLKPDYDSDIVVDVEEFTEKMQ